MQLERFITTVVYMMALLSSNVCAQSERQCINYFYAKGEVCLPVRVKHSVGEFFIYNNGERYDGFLHDVEAWDCEGRHIISPTLATDGYSTDKSKPIVRNYVFEYLYPGESRDGELETEAEMQSSDSGLDMMDRLRWSVERGRNRYDPAYSNLTLQTGVSRVHGEFIRAKACLGGQTGYVLYGGVGRDWFFDAKNEKFLGPDAKKMGWHAGLGYYGGDLNGVTATGEFAFLMDYAETPMVDNGSLNIWLEGTWYFGADGHFGVFGGLGVSGGNLKNDELAWNFIFEVGLAYRFY